MIKYLLTVIMWFIVSCSSDGLVDSGDSAGPDIPIRHTSPISLYQGNRITYEHNLYDSTGTVIVATDTTFVEVEYDMDFVDTVWLPGKYGFDTLDAYKSGKPHFYTYRWEHSDTSIIISYYQANDEEVEQSGIVIVGRLHDTTTVLFDTPILWIPYPVTVSGNGDLLHTNDNDSTTNYQFKSSSEKIPGKYGNFLSTHCYRVGGDEKYSYHYYQIGDGLVAVIEYRNGKRYKTLKKIQ